MKTLLQALAIGTLVTLSLFGLGWAASDHGSETLSYALYWQAYVAQMLLPCSVVFRGEFLCQSESVGMFTFFSGIPIGILVYSSAAYFVLRRRAAQPRAASRAPDDLR